MSVEQQTVFYMMPLLCIPHAFENDCTKGALQVQLLGLSQGHIEPLKGVRRHAIHVDIDGNA